MQVSPVILERFKSLLEEQPGASTLKIANLFLRESLAQGDFFNNSQNIYMKGKL